VRNRRNDNARVWDFKAGDQVPPSYTVKLKGSIHVGGLVVDPDGNPVAEATVSLGRFWRCLRRKVPRSKSFSN
jgi:hypothetical protein